MNAVTTATPKPMRIIGRLSATRSEPDMLEAMEEVAARDIMPTLKAKASSTSPRARQSCAHICCPRVEPMTLRVLMLLILKGTEAMAKLTKLIIAISSTSIETVSRVMVVERLPLAMLSPSMSRA